VKVLSFCAIATFITMAPPGVPEMHTPLRAILSTSKPSRVRVAPKLDFSKMPTIDWTSLQVVPEINQPRYSVGEPILLRFRITNHSDYVLAVSDRPRALAAVMITDSSGNALPYRPSRTAEIVTMISGTSIAKGKTYTTPWYPTERWGYQPAQSGRYTVIIVSRARAVNARMSRIPAERSRLTKIDVVVTQ